MTGRSKARSGGGLLAILSVALGLGVAGPAAAASEPFDASDSLYQARETRTAEVLQGGARDGFTLKVDTVRFGAYSLEVTQQLDPATGWPPEKQQWGDWYHRIYGLSGSWAYWFMLQLSIRLDGADKDAPNPTSRGLLRYLGLREVTNEHIVAEAYYQDPEGGYLRERLVAWRGVPDRFGMILRYFPPAERQLTSLVWHLYCTPLWYNTGERKRWIVTPLSDAEAPMQPRPLDLTQEWAMVFCNHLALQTAGGTLALDPTTVVSATVGQDGAGTIGTHLTPVMPGGEVRAVLGDWAGESYVMAAPRYLASLAAVKKDLERTAALRLPAPQGPSDAERAEVEELLLYAPLAAKYGEQVAAAQAELEESLERMEDTPQAFLRWAEASKKWGELVNAMKSDWIKQKLWMLEG